MVSRLNAPLPMPVRVLVRLHGEDGSHLDMEMEVASTPEDIARRQLYFSPVDASAEEMHELRAAGKDALRDGVADVLVPDALRGRKDRKDKARAGRTGGRGRGKVWRGPTDEDVIAAVRALHTKNPHLSWTRATDCVASTFTRQENRMSGRTVRRRAAAVSWTSRTKILGR